MHGIICLLQVNEAGIDRPVELTSFFHQHSQGEELVGAASTPTKATLTFVKELLCSGLEPVQDGFGEHLTWYA